MKTPVIDIPPSEVQAFLEARHKRQKDRFAELEETLPIFHKNWYILSLTQLRAGKMSLLAHNAWTSWRAQAIEYDGLRKKLGFKWTFKGSAYLV